MTEKEEKKESGGWVVPVVIGGFVLLSIGGPLFAEEVWPHIYGATPADLEHLALSGSPKKIGHAAPATDVSTYEVRIRFKAGGLYERADISWDTTDLSAPNGIRLRPERDPKEGAEVLAAFARWFPLHGGEYRWGPVTFRIDSDGDARFTINRVVDQKPNPMFDRQLEAARQVLLNGAFGLPVSVSDAEIADTLGTGYPLSVIARSNLVAMPLEGGPAFVTAHFPSATRDGSAGATIPLAHPLVRSVSVRWDNRPRGAITSVDLAVTDAYKDARDAFATCLEPRLGAPTIKTTDYAAGKKNSIFKIGNSTLELQPTALRLRDVTDASFWAVLFDALDGCRESAEGGSKSGRR